MLRVHGNTDVHPPTSESTEVWFAVTRTVSQSTTLLQPALDAGHSTSRGALGKTCRASLRWSVTPFASESQQQVIDTVGCK
eukprot:1591248-Rhodomonas_salina.1